MTSKRRPEDILTDIDESDVHDAVERVLSMSSGERKAELEAAGFAEAELHTKAAGWHARMQRAAVEEVKARLEGEAREKALRAPTRGRRALLLVAAAAVLAVLLALLLLPRSLQRERRMAAPSATALPSAIPGSTAVPAPSRSAPLPEAAPEPHEEDGKPARK